MRRALRFVVLVGLVASFPVLAHAAPPILCATPGRDGSPATLTGVVNTYYPGTGVTPIVGGVTLTLDAASGAQVAIASGDLVLIMQMQDASMNTENTDKY